MKCFLGKHFVMVCGFIAWNLIFWSAVYRHESPWLIAFSLIWLLFYGLPLYILLVDALQDWVEGNLGDDCQ